MTAAVFNTKITEIENKIPDTSGIVTTTVFKPLVFDISLLTSSVFFSKLCLTMFYWFM